jgi:hypothetical protein
MVLKRKSTMDQYTHEEMLNILSQKGNANKKTLRCYVTTVRMSMIQKKKAQNAG